MKCLDSVFPFNSITEDEFVNTIGNNLNLQETNRVTHMLDVIFTSGPEDNSISHSSTYASPKTFQKLFSSRNPAHIAILHMILDLCQKINTR